MTKSSKGSTLGPLLLVLAGLAAFLAPIVFSTPASLEVLGGNLPVNPGATDLRDISSHNSPTLVRNPRNGANLAISNRIDTPSFSCALHISTDGGAGWTQTPIPVPPGEEPKCYGPDVAFGKDGSLYLSFVTLRGDNNVPNAVWTARSGDGGRTLTEPVRALGPLAFQTRLMADPDNSGVVYLTWLQAAETATLAFPETGYPIHMAVSPDGGLTWGKPVRVSHRARERVVAPSPAAGPGGKLYVLYLDLGEDKLDYEGGHEGKGGEPYRGHWQLVLAESDDRAKSWKETVVERRLVPTERFVIFLPPTPSIVAGPDGSVLAGFQDGRRGDSDVYLWRREGASGGFGAAVRVNDTPGQDGTSQYLPRLSLDGTTRVDVVYYDRRSDRKDRLNEVSFQSSFDGGSSFSPRIRLSDTQFDSRIGFGVERDLPDLGSRLALISAQDRAMAAWTDTRAGTPISKKQDIVRALVRIDGPAGIRAAQARMLRLGGGGTALFGLAVLFWSLIRRARGGPRR